MKTKTELIEAVASEVGLSKKQATAAVNAFLNFVMKAVSEDGLRIVGFGSFVSKERAARKGRNINTGEVIEIPARRVVVFKPGASLKEAVQS